MEAIETVEKGELIARLYQDEEPQSPADWDMIGTLVTWHRSYTFQEDGAKRFGTPQDFLREAKRGRWVWLNIAMIDHSGISLYEGTGAHMCDPGGWDSGQVGFLYATRASWRKCMGTVRQHGAGSRWEPENVREKLRGDLETWKQYVSGDVYYYAVETADGTHVDSLGGIYGFDYAKGEMLAALDGAHAEAEAGERLVATGFAL